MRLKGLVWFFTIALILISLWELSYTLVVRNYENKVKAQVTRTVQRQSPNLPKDEQESIVKARTYDILHSDSAKQVEIYPIIGTTYQKSKEEELNLGLDLQGGMSVTMEVGLEGLIKSLSNNSSDSSLLRALRAATLERTRSEGNYIDLFATAFKEQNGDGKLSLLFAGPGKEIKAGDNDNTVRTKLKETARGAINQTYKILIKRIDKFGVAQPNINLDENKGVINVELAGISNPDRVRKFLTSSANLQFWSVVLLQDKDFETSLGNADRILSATLKGAVPDSTGKIDSSSVLSSIVQFPVNQQTGGYFETGFFGSVLKKDTSKLNSYLNNPVFRSNLPNNVKILYGVEQKNPTGQPYFEVFALEKTPGTDKAPMEGESVDQASQSFDEKGRPSIKMQMTNTGTRDWANLTEKNDKRFVAIVLDDIVYSAPRVNGKIEGGDTEISGNFTVEEAQDLANILKTGKLDAPAKIVASQIVGPTLGKEAVKGGAIAFIVAFGIIFILMMVYYNTAGWVANIALILNLLFTVGVLAALGFTLTAAGIAGLVLTIGMAVDTNVIIFERIKDELTRGKSYSQAVADGYNRSLPPVLDAHITSLITAIILAYFGLGPVLGFATTQILGITLSLFCGILVSRLITDYWTKKNRHFNYFTKVSKRIFRNANYKFIEFRKVTYIFSALVLIGGVAAFFNGFHQGVEFKGGRSYTVEFNKNVSNDDIREDLKVALEGDNPTIKTVGDNRHLNITTAYLKGDDNADSAVQARLFQGLNKVLPANTTYQKFAEDHLQSYSTVLPSISDDLKRGAFKAAIFAILAIFLYIFIRFRDWRYSAGTIITILHDVLVTLIVFSFFKNIVPFPLEIDQHFIAAILTVIGFSMNDTVVVFDRIREYAHDMKGATKGQILNAAINDTLSRTVMTSVTVLLVLLALFIFGGEVTRGFAFAMLIGVLTGIYSSIFVGAPVLMDFAKDKPLGIADTKKEVVAKPGAKAVNV